MSPEKNSVYRFGIYEFDTRGAELRKNGSRIRLQEQSRQVLAVLLEHPGEIVTREDLRSLLWTRDTFVDFETGLNTIVKRLRQTLGDTADNPTFIETIPRKGYRFITPVETLHPPFVYKSNTASPSVGDARQRRRTLRLLAITGGIFGILLSGVLLLNFRSSSQTFPRIAASHRLTDSGYYKSSLVTDGKTLYYWEKRPTGFATMQLSVNGGEASELTGFPKGYFRGISPDGSELLIWVTDPKTGVGEAWIQPLPGGTARLVVDNARWPVWTPDGSGIIFARNDRVLFRASADGTNIRQLATLPDISGISVSPDGKRI